MPQLADGEARRRAGDARVARLATTTPDGRPHLVPITFAFAGGRLVTAVDAKPKRHRRLQRLTNIAADPRVSVLVDHYSDDWSQLWWVRLDGVAEVLSGGGDDRRPALASLADKYPPYRRSRPSGPVIAVTLDRVGGWQARSG